MFGEGAPLTSNTLFRVHGGEPTLWARVSAALPRRIWAVFGVREFTPTMILFFRVFVAAGSSEAPRRATGPALFLLTGILKGTLLHPGMSGPGPRTMVISCPGAVCISSAPRTLFFA